MFPVMLIWGLISPLLPPKFTPAPPTRTIIHKSVFISIHFNSDLFMFSPYLETPDF